MADYILDQTPVRKGGRGSDDVRLFVRTRDALLVPAEEVSPEEMAEYFYVSKFYERYLGTIRQHIAMGVENDSLMLDALKNIKIPAGESFTFVNFQGGGSAIYRGSTFALACSPDANCIEFDIIVTDLDDNVIAEKLGIKGGEGVSNVPIPIKPSLLVNGAYYVQGGNGLKFKIKFNKFPYTGEDGSSAFWDECNPPKCFFLRVHHMLEDTCLSDLVGTTGPCGGGCCFEMPEYKCPEPMLTDNCSDNGVGPIPAPAAPPIVTPPTTAPTGE